MNARCEATRARFEVPKISDLIRLENMTGKSTSEYVCFFFLFVKVFASKHYER